jgi:large subunit ribosomal protein L6
VSRIGKKPIQIPSGVTVSIADGIVKVKGAKHELSVPLVNQITASIDQGNLIFERHGETGDVRAAHGLCRALARNAIVGVSTGFTRRLEILGVGYRAEVKGKTLVLNLGYSHPVEFPIPDDVGISVEKDGKITLSGFDKGRIGQVAAIIRGFRPPDRYKGKGVRFEGERVALKEGKSA